jgi:hypothetical protein
MAALYILFIAPSMVTINTGWFQFPNHYVYSFVYSTKKGLEGKPSKPLISLVELEGIEPTTS